MKKIITPNDVVALSDIPEYLPIFAKEKGKFKGMLVKEKDGWIVKLGGESGAYGHHPSRRKCIDIGANDYGYEFFVED